MSFAMPQSTQRTFFDPNVFAKRPGYDYAARADEAWREIEENQAALDVTKQRYGQTLDRYLTGDSWVAMNPDHIQYLQGIEKKNSLYNDVQTLAINIRSLHRVIWNQCCTLYACLYHMEREAWLAGKDLTLDPFSPEGIWQQVCPDHPAPGSWPPGPKDHYIERKVHDVGWAERGDER